MFTDDKG